VSCVPRCGVGSWPGEYGDGRNRSQYGRNSYRDHQPGARTEQCHHDRRPSR
jgi:hypothetical protein